MVASDSSDGGWRIESADARRRWIADDTPSSDKSCSARVGKEGVALLVDRL